MEMMLMKATDQVVVSKIIGDVAPYMNYDYSESQGYENLTDILIDMFITIFSIFPTDEELEMDASLKFERGPEVTLPGDIWYNEFSFDRNTLCLVLHDEQDTLYTWDYDI